jgi:hypothetical protein
MSATLSPTPNLQVFDSNGIPMAGALLYAYAGSSSTPKDLYTNAIGDTAETWPLLADSGGRFNGPWLGTGTYKLVLKDSDGVQIWSVDGITNNSGVSLVVNTVIGASNSLRTIVSGSAQYVTCLGYRVAGDLGGGNFMWSAGSSAIDDGGMIIQCTDVPATGRYLRQFEGPIDIRWTGAYGDGINSDTNAVIAANNYAYNNNNSILIPAGTFLLSTNPWTGSSTYEVPIEFTANAKLSWSSFSPAIDPIIYDNKQHFVLIAATDYPVFPARRVVNPAWYGVIGNGTTDDTIPMQCAFLSAKNGGKVQLSDGTFSVGEDAATTATLTLVSGIEVSGKGKSSTLKFLSAKATDYGLIGSAAGTDLENVYLHDLAIDGNKSGQSAGYGIKFYGRNCRIENVHVKDCLNRGIVFNQVADGTGNNILSSCVVTDSSIGISSDGWYDGRVCGNSIYMGDATGIIITDTTRTVISENKILSTMADSTHACGIAETRSDTTYGLNYISGCVTDYALGARRYIDIGNSVDVEINGDATILRDLIVLSDATVYSDMTVGGNLEVQNSIVNTALYNLLRSYTGGFDFTSSDTCTGATSNRFEIGAGSAMLWSGPKTATGHIGTLVSAKTIAADGTWTRDGTAAVASACYPLDSTSWAHVFLVGSPNDTTDVRLIIDTDKSCGNGLVDTAVLGYTEYRRLCEIPYVGRYGGVDYGVGKIVQKGTEFRIRGTQGTNLWPKRRYMGSPAGSAAAVTKIDLSVVDSDNGGTGCPSVNNGVYINVSVAESGDYCAFGDGNSDFARYYLTGTTTDPTYYYGPYMFLQTSSNDGTSSYVNYKTESGFEPSLLINLMGWRDERTD